MKDSLSVVIPVFNEEARIYPTLERLDRYLQDTFDEFEIIVVDDGSSDNTALIVQDLGRKLGKITLIRYPVNAGKGYAIRTGVLASKGDLLLTCDADLSTPIEEVEKLLSYVDAGSAIAIGSRGLSASEIVMRQPWHRERMGRIFNVMVRTLLFGGIKDTQCGFKLFKGEAARRLFERSLIKGFSFDVEILFLARKLGYTVKEIPVRWFNSPHSKVRLLKDPIKMFLDLLRIRLYWLLGKYRDRT